MQTDQTPYLFALFVPHHPLRYVIGSCCIEILDRAMRFAPRAWSISPLQDPRT